MAAGVMLGVAGVFAVVDWYAVATRHRTLEYVCKPATTLAFLASALALDPVYADRRAWFCAALFFCTAGDVFLMLPRDAFIPGLASFLVAQLCFAVGFALHLESAGTMALGVAVVGVVATPLSVRFVRALGVERRGSLVAPVLAYVAAISVMVATAIGTGNALAVIGASLFFASDTLIGETRFVGPRAWGPLAVIVSYHLALAGLVSSLVT